jgi:hypothetical protein
MHQRLAAAPSIVTEELDDEICLYRSEVDEVLVLNYTASDIWRLAVASTSIEEITDALAAKYSIEPAAARDEVVRVTSDLCERGFLVESAPSNSSS